MLVVFDLLICIAASRLFVCDHNLACLFCVWAVAEDALYTQRGIIQETAMHLAASEGESEICVELYEAAPEVRIRLGDLCACTRTVPRILLMDLKLFSILSFVYGGLVQTLKPARFGDALNLCAHSFQIVLLVERRDCARRGNSLQHPATTSSLLSALSCHSQQCQTSPLRDHGPCGQDILLAGNFKKIKDSYSWNRTPESRPDFNTWKQTLPNE